MKEHSDSEKHHQNIWKITINKTNTCKGKRFRTFMPGSAGILHA